MFALLARQRGGETKRGMKEPSGVCWAEILGVLRDVAGRVG